MDALEHMISVSRLHPGQEFRDGKCILLRSDEHFNADLEKPGQLPGKLKAELTLPRQQHAQQGLLGHTCTLEVFL